MSYPAVTIRTYSSAQEIPLGDQPLITCEECYRIAEERTYGEPI